jgi:hypothetical protein
LAFGDECAASGALDQHGEAGGRNELGWPYL